MLNHLDITRYYWQNKGKSKNWLFCVYEEACTHLSRPGGDAEMKHILRCFLNNKMLHSIELHKRLGADQMIYK